MAGLPKGGLADPQSAHYQAASLSSSVDSPLTNHPESKTFLTTALAWQGTVTPKVMPRVTVVAAYAALVQVAVTYFPELTLPVTPFEYSGAVLTLILVLRVNAGHDRWWEARKLWGNIVNQSRNLAVVVCAYSKSQDPQVATALNWIAAWPHVMRESLRKENQLKEVAAIIGPQEAQSVRQAENMCLYVALKIATLLEGFRNQGMDPFAFHRAETERSQLVDAFGACERIRNTRMPFVLAVKSRRFLLLFLLLLPFAFADRTGWMTPIVVALASYPLFSLDEIGAELQNPFSPRNLSHLPLTDLCKSIAKSVLSLGRTTL